MTTKSKRRDQIQGATPTPNMEGTNLRNMRATKVQEAIDKAAAETHPLKGDVDRAGFDLGGVDGEPADAGLRDVETPVEK